MSEKVKAILCVVISLIIMYIAGFSCGYYRCNKRISEYQWGNIDEQYSELEQKQEHLERELEERIAECERYEQQLGNIESGLDGCMDIVRLMRRESDISGIESTEIKSILAELRKRYAIISERCNELEVRLGEYKESIDIK